MKTTATTPATTARTQLKRRRSRVKHYWWMSEGETARSLGIYEVPAICGRAWVKLPDASLIVKVTQTEDGELVFDGAPNPCKVCERMLGRRQFGPGRKQGQP